VPVGGCGEVLSELAFQVEPSEVCVLEPQHMTVDCAYKYHPSFRAFLARFRAMLNTKLEVSSLLARFSKKQQRQKRDPMPMRVSGQESILSDSRAAD
jgi:hypothetical protein